MCREDFQAEMELFEQMRRDLTAVIDRVHRMQMEIDRLSAQIPSPSVSVWIPTVRTWDVSYGQSIADMADIDSMRRAVASIRDWMTELPSDPWLTYDYETGRIITSNSNTN